MPYARNKAARIIAAERLRLGLLPHDVAKEAGVATNVVSRLEDADIADPHADVLSAVAGVLHVPLESFFGSDDLDQDQAFYRNDPDGSARDLGKAQARTPCTGSLLPCGWTTHPQGQGSLLASYSEKEGPEQEKRNTCSCN